MSKTESVSDAPLDSSTVIEPVDETVSYETHKRLLGQRKTDQERLKALQVELEKFQLKEQDEEQKRLEESGKYQEALATYKTQVEKERAEKLEYEKRLVDGTKYQAFLDKLPGRLKNKDYLAHVPVDAIPMDPETGLVDDVAVEALANEFLQKHPSLVETVETVKIPNGAPQNVAPSTYEEELKACKTQAELDALFKKHKRPGYW